MYSSQHKFAAGQAIYFPTDDHEVTRDTVIAVLISDIGVRYATAYGREKCEADLFATPQEAFDSLDKV